MSQALVATYRNVVFLVDTEFDPTRSFAIITAHNPLGRILTKRENARRNQALEGQLTSYFYQTIIGAAPDLSHQEASFAVACSKQQAIELALKHEQNAIYWVEAGRLWLEPVALSFTPIELGPFSDFLATF